MDPIEEIRKEFEKQDKLWGLQHDREHIDKELAKAAIAYLQLYISESIADRHFAKSNFPWADGWNPKKPQDILRVAGAWIASEMRRLDEE